jgi:hypothetical protein
LFFEREFVNLQRKKGITMAIEELRKLMCIPANAGKGDIEKSNKQ